MAKRYMKKVPGIKITYRLKPPTAAERSSRGRRHQSA